MATHGFFYMLDITASNTYIMYADTMILTFKRRNFLIKLGEILSLQREVGVSKRQICYDRSQYAQEVKKIFPFANGPNLKCANPTKQK